MRDCADASPSRQTMLRPVLCTLSAQMRRLCLSRNPSGIWTVVALNNLTLQKRQSGPCSAIQCSYLYLHWYLSVEVCCGP